MTSPRQRAIQEFHTAAARNRERADQLGRSTDPADQLAARYLRRGGALMSEDRAQRLALRNMVGDR